MNFHNLKKFKSLLIFIIIVIFMVFSLWLRNYSATSIDLSRYITWASPDVWYNFRLVDLTIHNFPHYIGFDPMTAYPTGKVIDWGPLLPFIGSGISILAGMTTGADMMYLVSWISPVFAALLVPVVYLVGRYLWDYRVGLVASGLITVISSVFFIKTSFGNFDHHGSETLFGTLFCLLYIITLIHCRRNSPGLKENKAFLIFIILACSAAGSYFLGYLNMPTIILFGLIAGIFTFIQMVWDVLKEKPVIYFLYTNLAIFFPVLILMALFGFNQQGIALSQYSIGQPIAITILILETVIIYGLSKYSKSNKKIFAFSILLSFSALILFLQILVNGSFSNEIITFFGQSVELGSISEAGPWSPDLAYISFNFAIILAVIGFVLLLYRIYSKKKEEHLFFAIWTLVILAATIQHLRFEYYFVVNMALLSSIGIVLCIESTLGFMKRYDGDSTGAKASGEKKEFPSKKSDAKKIQRGNKREINAKSRNNILFLNNNQRKLMGSIIIVGILLIAISAITISIRNDLTYSTAPDRLINQSWIETMEWLNFNTPDPGIDYYLSYSKAGFSYPPQSYGIISWWDYGNYITYIAKRIPVTNPFQDNLAGSRGVAAFFLSDSEVNATKIINKLGARYVITDTSTATEKFPAITDWYNPNPNGQVYIQSFFQKNPPNANQLLQLNGELGPYFQTVLVRLHNFDGSMITPGKTVYIEYYTENRNGLDYPIATKAQILDTDTAVNATRSFSSPSGMNLQAIEVGQFLQPIEKLPALQHFRLVYESPAKSTGLRTFDRSQVETLNLIKVFEYVKGAPIKGEGTIEIEIVTNTGRIFNYTQESVNGSFIVPYSTLNNPYDVKGVGKYHIVGTDKTIDVSEDEVVNGTIVV
jgi:dolichyl-phosphooligosaccharide-protein glycotransferase